MTGGNGVAHPAAVLRAAFAHSDLTQRELFLEHFTVGGPLRSTRLEQILQAGAPPTKQEYDEIASALNGWYVDQGLGHAVPYYDELWVNGDGEVPGPAS